MRKLKFLRKLFFMAIAAVFIIFSLTACDGTSDTAQKGAVSGNFYLDGDTSKEYISFNEDNSFVFVGFDYNAFAKELLGDMLEDTAGIEERLRKPYNYQYDDAALLLAFDIFQSDSGEALSFLVTMELAEDKNSLVFHEKTYKLAQ